jgi:hypothetical protein
MSNNDDRENLKMIIRSTIEHRFGSIADSVRNFMEKKEIPIVVGEILQKFVRTQGNYAIRTLEQHLDHNHIIHKDQEGE